MLGAVLLQITDIVNIQAHVTADHLLPKFRPGWRFINLNATYFIVWAEYLKNVF